MRIFIYFWSGTRTRRRFPGDPGVHTRDDQQVFEPIGDSEVHDLPGYLSILDDHQSRCSTHKVHARPCCQLVDLYQGGFPLKMVKLADLK